MRTYTNQTFLHLSLVSRRNFISPKAHHFPHWYHKTKDYLNTVPSIQKGEFFQPSLKGCTKALFLGMKWIFKLKFNFTFFFLKLGFGKKKKIPITFTIYLNLQTLNTNLLEKFVFQLKNYYQFFATFNCNCMKRKLLWTFFKMGYFIISLITIYNFRSSDI